MCKTFAANIGYNILKQQSRMVGRGRGFARKEVIEMVDKLNEMTKWPEVEVAVSRKCNNK